jgi:hypothetical protein
MRAAEANTCCCGFVRQVEKNWYYWKRCGSGFSRIFRRDAASVCGEWESMYIEERVPGTQFTCFTGTKVQILTLRTRPVVVCAGEKEREEDEEGRRRRECHAHMEQQAIKPSLKKHWHEAFCVCVCVCVRNMYVCMYVCMYVYVYTYIHTYINEYLYIYK